MLPIIVIIAGSTVTATIVSGGIMYLAVSQIIMEKNNAKKHCAGLPLSSVNTTILLEQIPHFYPMTTFDCEDKESIVFFNNDSTVNEQRLAHLKQILEDFSIHIQKFEKSLKNGHGEIEEVELKSIAPILLKGLEISSQKLKLAPFNNENHAKTLDSMIIEFNTFLQKLSTTVSQSRMTSSMFSFAHHIDLIHQAYHASKNKRSVSFFAPKRSKIFEEDLAFIKDVSYHTESTDEIRIASLIILKNKNNTYLLKLDRKINELINLTFKFSKNTFDYNHYCQLFADFCHQTETIIPPDQLQNYFNQNKRSINKSI